MSALGYVVLLSCLNMWGQEPDWFSRLVESLVPSWLEAILNDNVVIVGQTEVVDSMLE